jgi:hypothetical protein
LRVVWFPKKQGVAHIGKSWSREPIDIARLWVGTIFDTCLAGLTNSERRKGVKK